MDLAALPRNVQQLSTLPDFTHRQKADSAPEIQHVGDSMVARQELDFDLDPRLGRCVDLGSFISDEQTGVGLAHAQRLVSLFKGTGGMSQVRISFRTNR